MKTLIIKLLFKLIGSPFTWKDTVNEKRMSKWLALQYPLQEFRDYIHKRDMEILQIMGNIIPREDYLVKVGQRMELGRLLTYSRECYDRENKELESKKSKTVHN